MHIFQTLPSLMSGTIYKVLKSNFWSPEHNSMFNNPSFYNDNYFTAICILESNDEMRY